MRISDWSSDVCSSDLSEVMDRLGHSGIFPEGRFFPDTYRFVRGTSDADLLKIAYNRLEEVLAKEWAQRAADLPYSQPYQDRKRVVLGKCVSGSVDLGGCRTVKKKKQQCINH